MFSSGKPGKPSLMYAGKTRNIPLKGAPLGLAPTLLANIRLDWKGWPGANTVAYLEH